jgi:glucose/arabinose dehydrogenase
LAFWPNSNIHPKEKVVFNQILGSKRIYLIAFVFLALGALVLIQSSFIFQDGQKAEASSAGALNLSLQTFATGLNEPVSIANAGPNDDRLFVVERAGRIKIVQAGGNVLSTPFLSIPGRVNSSGSEQGLLGLVFHPDYASNGYFYVNYTNTSSGVTRTRISRFQVTGDPNVADPASEEILLTVVQPFTNHNAGDIHFGPDGYLYIPLGDGGDAGDPFNNAQTLDTLLGKVSRIDVDSGPGSAPDCEGAGTGNYTIPASNPFSDGSGGACDEIWALGVRNPWRSSFDSTNGDFYIGDVGQGLYEEIDFQPSGSSGGENYGWRCYEGNHTYNTSGCGPAGDYEFPVFEYSHPSGDGCTVIGGYVYRGWQYPDMYGRYFLADYCSGYFWDLTPGSWAATKHTNMTAAYRYVSFGEAADGELYVAGLSNGVIYHLVEDTLVTPTSSVTPTPTATCEPTLTPPPPTETPGPTPYPENSYLPAAMRHSVDHCD